MMKKYKTGLGFQKGPVEACREIWRTNDFLVVFLSNHTLFMIRKLFFSLACVLLAGLVANAQSLPKEVIDNYKFTAIKEGAKVESYFIVKDTVHQEYVDGKLFAVSKIEWLPGNRYNAILRWMTPEIKTGATPGDIMKMEMLSFKNDTLTLRITFKDGRSFTAKYLRSEIESNRSRPMS